MPLLSAVLEDAFDLPAILRESDLEDREALEFLAVVAVLRAGRVVHTQEPERLIVEHRHGMWVGFEEHAEAALALTEILLEVVAVGDVAAVEDHAPHGRLVEQVRCDRFESMRVAVLVEHVVLVGGRIARRAQELIEVRRVLVAGTGRPEPGAAGIPAAAEHRRGVLTGESCDRRAQVHEAPVGVQHCDQIAGVLDHRLEANPAEIGGGRRGAMKGAAARPDEKRDHREGEATGRGDGGDAINVKQHGSRLHARYAHIHLSESGSAPRRAESPRLRAACEPRD